MPQSGVHHDLMVGRTNNENSHPQYVSKRYYNSVLSTFWPAASVGAVPDTGTNMTPFIQLAIDNAPDGTTIYFQPGTYILSTPVVVTRSDQTLWLDPGTLFAAADTAIEVTGTEITGSATDITTDPIAGAVSIAVTSNTNFPADTWVIIRDDADADVSPGQSEWIHMEVNRVKSLIGGTVINLYYPLRQPYSTLTGVKPSMYPITPVENFCLTGGGRISSHVGTASGGHGVHGYCTVGLDVNGVEFFNVFDSCVHVARSLAPRVHDDVVMRDAVRFDSRGYGFTCHSVWDAVVTNCTMRRLRHGIDFSMFSGKCIAANNTISGSANASIDTHPSVKQIQIIANNIDGAYGENPGGTDWGTNVQASGINVDVSNTDVIVADNVIRNTRLSGIFVDTGGTENIAIRGNTVVNCNITESVDHGGITVLEQSARGTLWEGHVVENNQVVDCWNYGIRAGMTNMEVKNNRVVGTVSSTAALGIGYDIRNNTGAHGVTGVMVQGNMAWKNQSDGFSFGVGGSASTVERCVVQHNTAFENGRHGIHGLETSHFNYVDHNLARDNGFASAGTYDGIVFQGDNNLLSFNISEDLGGAVQRFGIEVPVQANATILRGNFCRGNTSASYSITGTNTEWSEALMREVVVADTNHTFNLDFLCAQYSTLTAARVVTMPAANAVGIELRVYDASGNCSGANTLTLTRAGADTFADGGGATTFVLNTPYASAHVRCIAIGTWKLV